MNFLSWNCQGVGRPQDLVIPRLKKLRKKHFPEMLFLMESKNSRNVLVDLHEWLGYGRVYTVEPMGSSGGLALFWKNSVEVDLLYIDKNLLDCKVKFGSCSFYISFIYGDHVVKYRPRLWERITIIGIHRKESWSIVGDFNDILHNGENVGGPSREESLFQPFGNMVRACKMTEAPSHGNPLTWGGGGMRYKLWVQCQLDRCFGNKEWSKMFSASNQTFLEKRGSGHRPVLVKLLSSQEVYRGQFRFDKRILHKPRVKECIEEAWNSPGFLVEASISDMIHFCRKALSKWKKENNTNIFDQIQQLQVVLEEEQSSCRPCSIRVNMLKRDLFVAYKEEETFWSQKSMDRWLD